MTVNKYIILVLSLIIVLLASLSLTRDHAIISDNIQVINSTTGIQYIVIIGTAENSSAISNGTGSFYQPIPPIKWIDNDPQNIIQWLLRMDTEFNTNGSGKWYPPIPPVKYLDNQPQYIIQWIMPSGPGHGFQLSINVSVNTTEVYVGEPIHVNVTVYSPLFNTMLTGDIVYLYDVYENGSVLNRKTLVLENGSTEAMLSLWIPGNHTLYAIYPGQGIYSSSRSNNVTVSVNRYPLALTLSSDRNTIEYNETFQVIVHGVNPITGNSVSNIPVTLYVIRNNTIIDKVEKLLDDNGQAIFSLSIGSPGNYTLYAVSSETVLYEQAISNNITVTIVYPVNPMGGTPVALCEHCIVILILSIAIILSVLIFSGKRGRGVVEI